MNEDAGQKIRLETIRRLLWKALESSSGMTTKVKANNTFRLDDNMIQALGDRPIIINNQINKVDIKAQANIYAAIRALDKLKINLVKVDFSVDNLVSMAFDAGMDLEDLKKKIEVLFLDLAINKSPTKAEAARRIGLKRTAFHEKCKRFGIGE